MDDNLLHWKARLPSLDRSRADFEKWLFLQVAPVLRKCKPAEFLNFPASQFDLTLKDRQELAATTAELWGLANRTLHETHRSAKILLFRPEGVARSLDRIPPDLLEVLGYPSSIGAFDFVEQLCRRWVLAGEIPHEIGFVLGYPIKDVVGYMKLEASIPAGHCGWQIFGEAAPSLRVSEEFRQADGWAVRFLFQNENR